jgi:hypothetical protein
MAIFGPPNGHSYIWPSTSRRFGGNIRAVNAMAGTDIRQHWDEVYGRRAVDEVSWFEPVPKRSLELIVATGVAPDAVVIDVGGGASTLVDELLARNFTDLTLVDISGEVLAKVTLRLGAKREPVELMRQDVTTFQPERCYAVWHDRAVFHFLLNAAHRQSYRRGLLRGTQPGSHVIIATFGPEGPTRCSGLDTARYDAATLASELGHDFTLASSCVETHVTPTGAQQQFLYTHFVRR